MADSDVPPLEDMSDLLQHVGTMRENMGMSSGNTGYCSSTGSNIQYVKPPDHERAVQRDTDRNRDKPQNTEICRAKTNSNTGQVNPNETTSGKFGGLKKGFLFGNTKSKSDKDVTRTKQDGSKSVTERQEEENIPYIRPNRKEDDDSKFRFTEVQKAMEASQQFLDKKDWVTDDLLTQIQQNETLSRRMTDPTFVQAIGEFQKDPKAASEKYQNNPEMQKFFTDFCNIMGDHFSRMAESSEKTATSSGPTVTEITDQNEACLVSEEDKKVQDILANPELREILVDPEIQSLFEMLRTRPEEASRYLQGINNEMRLKIRKLVEAGLLQLQV